jgi:hypothetical protein
LVALAAVAVVVVAVVGFVFSRRRRGPEQDEE